MTRIRGLVWILLVACHASAPGGGGSGGNGGGGSGGNGGTGGSGGNGGTGGGNGPPTMVLPCNSLPAGGAWEDITPAAFRAGPMLQTLSVIVDPNDPSIVFSVAGDKTNGGNGGTGVYQSSDCGATFTKVSTGRSAASLESGDVWQLAIDSSNSKTLYATNGYGDNPTLYKSTNGGVDWDPLKPDSVGVTSNFVQTFVLDPTNPEHIVLTFHEDCKAPFAPMCLSESKDAGATWRLVKGPGNGWKEGAFLSVLDDARWMVCNGDGVFYTGDSGNTWTEALTSYQGILAAWVFGGYIATDGNMYLGVGNQGLIVSPTAQIDGSGKSWTKIAGSPVASGMIDDGETLYASNWWDTSGQPFYSAQLGQIGQWTHMPSPPIPQGSPSMAYDPAHHIIYAATWSGGLWRLITH